MLNTKSTINFEPKTVRPNQNETRSKYKFDAISDMSKTRRLYLNTLVKTLTKNYARHRRLELRDIDTDLATGVLSCARSLEMRVARGRVQEEYHENLTELLNQIDSKTQNRTLFEDLMLHIEEPNKDCGKDNVTSLRRHSYNNEHSSTTENPCAKNQRLDSYYGKELSLKKSAPLAVISIDPHCERNQPPKKHTPSTDIIDLPEPKENSDPFTLQNVSENTKDLITHLPLPVPPPKLNNKFINKVPDAPILNSSLAETIPLEFASQENEIRNSALQKSNMWSGHGWENIQPWVNYMYANQFMTINIPFTMSPHAYKDIQNVGDENYSDDFKSKIFLPPPPPNIDKVKPEFETFENQNCTKNTDFLKKEFYTPVTHFTQAKETLFRKNKYAELLKTALCSSDHWETIEEWLNHTHYFPKPVKPSITKRKHNQHKQNNVPIKSPKYGRKHSFEVGNMPQTFQNLKSRYKSRQPPPKSSMSKIKEKDIVHSHSTDIPKFRGQLKDRTQRKNSQSTFDAFRNTKPNIISHKSPLPLYSPPTNSPDLPWSIDTIQVTNKTPTPNKITKLSVPQPDSDLLDVERLLSKPIDFGEDNDTIIKGLEDMFQSGDELENKGTVDRICTNVCNESDLLRDLEDEDIYELTKCLEEGLEPTSTSHVEKDAMLKKTDISIVTKGKPNPEDIGNKTTFEQKLDTFSTLCENISEGTDNNVSAVKPESAPTIWPCEAYYQRLHLCQQMDKICDENWKKYNKIKIKFEQLFGENSEDELAPQSPIEETRAFMQSCKRRIVPWLLRDLTQYYKSRRIYNRSLFKVVARHLGMRIVEWNRYPSEIQVREYIQHYFRGHRKITCLSDIL